MAKLRIQRKGFRSGSLAGTVIAVGYHSGSHFTAIQALEVFLAPEYIKLRYIGRPMARLESVG